MTKTACISSYRTQFKHRERIKIFHSRCIRHVYLGHYVMLEQLHIYSHLSPRITICHPIVEFDIQPLDNCSHTPIGTT